MSTENNKSVNPYYAKILSDYMATLSTPPPSYFQRYVSQGEAVPITIWDKALHECQKISGQADFGLRVGAILSQEHLPPAWRIVYESTSLFDILLGFQKQGNIASTNNPLSLSIDAGRIAVKIPQVDGWVSQMSDEVGLAAIANFVRTVTGNQDVVLNVCFMGNKPANYRDYRRYFGCGVEFSCQQLEIVFDASKIDFSALKKQNTPPPEGHDSSHCYVESTTETDMALSRFTEQLIELINNGQTQVTDLAAKNGISVRALQRRLRDLDTTFNLLMRKTRLNLSKQYLLNETLSFDEVSARVGFSEQSAFNRAFKVWTGQTPGEWRNKNQHN